jgi:hypothetical protein
MICESGDRICTFPLGLKKTPVHCISNLANLPKEYKKGTLADHPLIPSNFIKPTHNDY